MILKDYQEKVLRVLRATFAEAANQRRAHAATAAQLDAALAALPPEMAATVRAAAAPTDWVKATAQAIGLPHHDAPRDGQRRPYPRLVVRVPTGGGKTLLAVEAIKDYQQLLAARQTGLVVWVVPSETIYRQTVTRLRDRAHWLRQLLDQASAGRTLILEKGQRLTRQDVEENLVVLFVMIQSLSRRDGGESLKVFQDSGGFDDFFPPDHRLDLHAELLRQVPNLDLLTDISRAPQPLVRTSLANAIRLSRPLLIIDEIHKVFTETARITLDGLNPALVLGFSATPKPEMNVAVSVSGRELLAEGMIKLDLHLHPPAPGADPHDWPAMVREVVARRAALEATADRLRQQTGLYVRPAALLQVEATGREQRGRGRVHTDDVVEYLTRELGIPRDQIVVKTAAQNELADDTDTLRAPTSPVRYFITRAALAEGWDYPFCYVLGIIPSVASNTALTQLVGRILRQPYARKFGVPALDESYVYFAKGETSALLTTIKKSFQDEGLDDLFRRHVTGGGGTGSGGDEGDGTRLRPVKIRPEFRPTDQATGLYLPVWLLTAAPGGAPRRFSYAADVAAALDFTLWRPTPAQLDALRAALSAQAAERATYTITLTERERRSATAATLTPAATPDVGPAGATALPLLTRRVAEVVPNPFAARTLASDLLAHYTAALGAEAVATHFGLVLTETARWLGQERARQEEARFRALLAEGSLALGITDDARLGYQVPPTDIILDDGSPQLYTAYLYERADPQTWNTLERRVADVLDRQQAILWWFRNRVAATGYAIRGWQRPQIRPDFVAARRTTPGGPLELVYVIESKGEQLAGNADSAYKQAVFELLNATVPVVTQTELGLAPLHARVRFEWVEEGQEEAAVRRLFK